MFFADINTTIPTTHTCEKRRAALASHRTKGEVIIGKHNSSPTNGTNNSLLCLVGTIVLTRNMTIGLLK